MAGPGLWDGHLLAAPSPARPRGAESPRRFPWLPVALFPEPLKGRKVTAYHKEPRPRCAASPQLWVGMELTWLQGTALSLCPKAVPRRCCATC